ELYKAFKTKERAWLHNQSKEHTISSASSVPIAPEDCSLHYGELAFLLKGLKPCLLLQLPTPAMTTCFYHQVLVPDILQHPAYKTLSNPFRTDSRTMTPSAIEQEIPEGLGLDCRLITRDVRSPEMSLQGYVLLWNTQSVASHSQAATIQQLINLLCPPPSHSHFMTSPTPALVSEQDLALMLDIPGRLPSTEKEIQTMVEVSYWDQAQQDTLGSDNNNDDSPVLLTAFAAQPDQISTIQAHFKRYRDSVQTLFDINLKLHIQAMANS
ncbi:hypothetical protein FBU30_011083, partial [Linnemannia zychae]